MICVICGRGFTYRRPGWKKQEEGVYICPKCAGHTKRTTLFDWGLMRKSFGAPLKWTWKPGSYRRSPGKRRK